MSVCLSLSPLHTRQAARAAEARKRAEARAQAAHERAEKLAAQRRAQAEARARQIKQVEQVSGMVMTNAAPRSPFAWLCTSRSIDQARSGGEGC